MPGSIVVDFAGTLAEARLFAKEHGLTAPQNQLYRQSNEAAGCACVAVPYKNTGERAQAIAKLESLGWEGSWFDTKGKSRVGHITA